MLLNRPELPYNPYPGFYGRLRMNMERYGELAVNPFTLRKTKIVYNFGLSECNKVNTDVDDSNGRTSIQIV